VTPPEYELESLQTIATFTSPWEAQLARAALEAEGIEAMIADEHLIRLYWALSNAIGGVKLQVRPDDAERATSLLASCKPLPELYLVSEEDAGQQRCPECRSARVDFERWSRLGFVSSWVLLGLPLPIPRNRWICRNCGAEWAPLAPLEAITAPAESPALNPALVTVARFAAPWLAHLACSRLEAAGIEACVFEERFPPVNLWTGVPLDLNRVEVHAADADLARQLLAAELAEELEETAVEA
jgi:rubredoxin